MYINTKKLKNHPFSVQDYFNFCAIKNNDFEYIAEHVSESDYRRYEAVSAIKYIKPKRKGQDVSELVRIHKISDVLEDITEADIEEQDIKILDWLCNYYINSGKEVGNKKRTARHIRDFRIKSGIQKNNLINLCLAFISDETNMEYSHKLEYLFYKPKNAFAAKFILEDSRLYSYFIKNRVEIEKKFETYE